LKDSDDKKGWWSSIRSRRQLRVVDSTGRRRRFLRGMITHDLVQRGIGFDDAYRIARAIREQIGDRNEVTTAEIRTIINKHLAERYGPELPPSLTIPVRPTAAIQVTYQGQPQPFSRGLLARSIHAAGVDLDRAYSLVTELESSLLTEGKTAISSDEIARRADQLLETFVGAPVAKRYRLLRRIHNLPRPLVIYVGGASGTGKSTLSLELAPLLRIYRINATDTIRQVMRMVFTPSIMPMLHASSFEAADYYGVPGLEEATGEHDTDHGERLITSFEEQAKRVCVGVRAVVERAISENMSIVVEGVHLVPGLVPFADLEGAAYQVPLVLATLDEEAHRARFLTRSRRGGRRAERYLENFDSIRAIHDYILLRAEAHEVPELETSSGDVPVIRTLQLVTGMLENRLPSLSSASQTTPE